MKHCDGCNGSGIRFPASPSCKLNPSKGYEIVERCDTCCLYPDDEAAGQVIGITEELICSGGGIHIAVKLAGNTRLS